MSNVSFRLRLGSSCNMSSPSGVPKVLIIVLFGSFPVKGTALSPSSKIWPMPPYHVMLGAVLRGLFGSWAYFGPCFVRVLMFWPALAPGSGGRGLQRSDSLNSLDSLSSIGSFSSISSLDSMSSFGSHGSRGSHHRRHGGCAAASRLPFAEIRIFVLGIQHIFVRMQLT